METKEWRFVDKSAWGSGPWQDEPDKAQWEDKGTKLPCMIHRNPGGALCGYVGVAEGHKLYARSYSEDNFDVHGGLTYSSFCGPTGEDGRGICHVPSPGEPDKVWWIGFDCAHGGDLCPDPKRNYSIWGSETYRDLPYVKEGCAKLALQLSRI